jgi:hypothetical protein
MRAWAVSAALLSLAIMGVLCEFGGTALAAAAGTFAPGTPNKFRPRYFKFLLIQPSMNLTISSLFRSRNISCMFPWMFTSSRRTKSSFAPA